MPVIPVGNTSVDIELEDGDLVLDAVIICRVIRADHQQGSAVLAVGNSDGLDWIVQGGMLHAAMNIDQLDAD